jgi:hypothetical protein
MSKAIAIKAPGSALTARKGALAKLANAGHQAISERLSDDIAADFRVAAAAGEAIGADREWLSRISLRAPSRDVELAKASYRSSLKVASRVLSAATFLAALRCPREPIERSEASAMLCFLLDVAGGKRSDEARLLKAVAIADIFSESNNVLGAATGLWQPVPRHPTLVALAIKQMEAQQIFEPCEAELRKALDAAAKKALRLEHHANDWLRLLRESDRLMFERDRDGWRAAHSDVDSSATLALSFDDDDGSAHQEALRNVWDQKYEAEQEAARAALEGEQMVVNDHHPPKQIAACAARPARRTQKL